MDKEPNLKTIPATIMLVLFLLVSFLGFEGTLLCFGKDGHMAIEFVDVHNGSGFGAQLAEIENDACGPCNDVQFLGSPAYTRKASNYKQALPLIYSSLISPSVLQEKYSNNLIILPVSSHHKTLASLHTVILLI